MAGAALPLDHHHGLHAPWHHAQAACAVSAHRDVHSADTESEENAFSLRAARFSPQSRRRRTVLRVALCVQQEENDILRVFHEKTKVLACGARLAAASLATGRRVSPRATRPDPRDPAPAPQPAHPPPLAALQYPESSASCPSLIAQGARSHISRCPPPGEALPVRPDRSGRGLAPPRPFGLPCRLRHHLLLRRRRALSPPLVATAAATQTLRRARRLLVRPLHTPPGVARRAIAAAVAAALVP